MIEEALIAYLQNVDAETTVNDKKYKLKFKLTSIVNNQAE